MAEQSGFFDAHLVDGTYDRVYLAEHFAKYFASFIGNGVFGGKSNELMVREKETPGMGIRVLPGQAWIDGYWYENDSEHNLTIDIADGVLNRIDSVVVRWNHLERIIRLAIKKGVAASNPVAPIVQRDDDYYELKLADIHIKAGTTKITQANITDKRLNTNECGLVIGVVQQLDADEFGIQLEEYISDFIAEHDAWKNATESDVENWANEFKTSYTNWFNQFKIDCNTAVNKLLSENQTKFNNVITEGATKINNLVSTKTTEIDKLISDNETKFNQSIEELEKIAEDNELVELTRDVESLKNGATGNAVIIETLGYTRKNLIPYPYSETSKDEHGLTWYDNRDGTITLNGETTSNAWFMLKSNLEEHDPLTLQPGEYIVSGGTEDCFLQVYSVNGTAVGSLLAENKYQETNFSISKATNVLVQIAVQVGANLSNLTIKPMLRSAKISDGTWEPYAPSVKERLDNTAIEDDYDIGCFYRINKQTGRKEWINPTCAPGWEYPLVEKWNNKPVYQMTFSTESLPVNSAMVIETLANWDKIVSVSGYAIDADDLTSYPFPIILHSQVTPIAVISRIEGDGALVITTNGDASRFKAYITVKYTKNE